MQRSDRQAHLESSRALATAAGLALFLELAFIGTAVHPAIAQQSAAPVVGVVQAERRPMTTSFDFVGRVEAIGKVDLVARVTGFLLERKFEEGTEVAANQVLFRIDPAQFEAEVERQKAAIASGEAAHEFAKIQLGRAQDLMGSPAGRQARVDDARSTELQAAAQVQSAKAALQLAEINLGYTEIKAPLAGKIGRSVFTVGAVVTPTSGTLATIVSQDPMRVAFPVSVRESYNIRQRLGNSSGPANARVRIRLPDGSEYPHSGHIDFIDSQVDRSTDTVLVRATLANPVVRQSTSNPRDLIDGAIVGVVIEGAQPQLFVTVPRSALMADQQGTYIFVVDKESRAQVRRIQLGQGTADIAAVEKGLDAGENVIVEGIQRVRPGQPVQASPAAPALRQPPQPR